MTGPPPDRIVTLVQAFTTALRDVARTNKVTPEEWRGALGFTPLEGHGELALLSGVMRLALLVDELTHPAPETRHPGDVTLRLWGEAPLLSNPAVLVSDDQPGARLVLRGQVRTRSGQTVGPAELDLCQCGAERIYDLDVTAEDPARSRGRLPVGLDGRYELRTIVPLPYEAARDDPVGQLLSRLGRHSWRPPHLYITVRAADHISYSTTLFFPTGDIDEPGSDDDYGPILQLDGASPQPVETTFDLVLP